MLRTVQIDWFTVICCPVIEFARKLLKQTEISSKPLKQTEISSKPHPIHTSRYEREMQDFDPKRVHFVQRSILFRFLNRFEEIREICAICEGISVQELIKQLQRKDVYRIPCLSYTRRPYTVRFWKPSVETFLRKKSITTLRQNMLTDASRSCRARCI